MFLRLTFEKSAHFSAFLTKFQCTSAHFSAILGKVFSLNFLKNSVSSAHFLHNFSAFGSFLKNRYVRVLLYYGSNNLFLENHAKTFQALKSLHVFLPCDMSNFWVDVHVFVCFLPKCVNFWFT